MFLPGNRDDCINRRFNFVSPLIALQFPVGTDQTMAGAIGAGKPRRLSGSGETEIFS